MSGGGCSSGGGLGGGGGGCAGGGGGGGGGGDGGGETKKSYSTKVVVALKEEEEKKEEDAVRWSRWEKNKQRNDGAIFLEDEESRISTRHAMSAIKTNRTPTLDVPDVKEYIVRCVASSGKNGRKDEDDEDMPVFSTCHRMYAMIETKTNHIRFASALSESE